jgi:hypothetical protein
MALFNDDNDFIVLNIFNIFSYFLTDPIKIYFSLISPVINYIQFILIFIWLKSNSNFNFEQQNQRSEEFK